MATVPYRPVPDVAASQQGIPGVDVPTPIQAFGGTIAQAIESVGRTAQNAGDEIFRRAIELQELENDRAKTEGETEFIIRAGEERVRYHTLEGQDAVADNQNFNQNIRRIREDIRNKMPNPRAARKFDNATLGDMGRYIFSGATHSAAQNRKSLEGTARANLAALAVEVYNDPSPSSMNSARSRARDNINQLGNANGWTQEIREQELTNFESHLTAQRIAGIAKDDPVAAQTLYDQSKGSLNPRDDLAAQTAVKNNLWGVEADRIASNVVGQVSEDDVGPGMSDREAVVAAGRMAKDIRDDPSFIEHVQQRTQSLLTRRRALVKDSERNAQYAINSVMAGGINGVRPTSLEELLQLDPNMQQHWDRLSPAARNAWFEKFDRNAKREYTWQEGPNGNRARFRQLQGMATGTAEEINQFLNIDMGLEKMPGSAIQQLVKLQRDTLKKAESNPAVGTAMNYYRNNGLLKDLNATEALNRPRNQEFRGALVDALVAFQSTNNRPATTTKDYDEIGKMLVRNMIVNSPPPQSFIEAITRPWTFGAPVQRGFELKPSDTLLSGWRNLQTERGVTVTKELEGDFIRQWRRREYQRLFGGSAGGEAR